MKRLLDGRRRIPLAHAGRSRFQPTGAANLAVLIRAVADAGAAGIFNAADPDSPDVEEIGQTVADLLGRPAEMTAVPQDAPLPVGATPWSVPRPFVVSDAAARAIGYRPVGTYRETVAAACRWLATENPPDWRSAFPQLAAYPWPLFDYAAEDRWLATNP